MEKWIEGGEVGGCGVECSKGMFFLRLWSEGMDEFKDIFIVFWLLRY